jgi:hypothetical protein
MASRQECWTLPHFASCPAQFADELNGNALLNDQLSRALGWISLVARAEIWNETRPFKGAPTPATAAQSHVYIRPRAACRQAAD